MAYRISCTVRVFWQRSRLLGKADLLEKIQLLLDFLHLAERVSILHLENVPRLHKQLDQLFGVHFEI